jgi:integrase
LRWEEVDLESGSIVRRPSKTSRRADKPVVIPIHPDLRRRLDEVRPVKASGFVCPTKAEQYARNRSEVSKRFSTVFRQCGIDLDGEGGHARAPVDVGFHSLRYSFVSICRRADAPLAVVESLVGHSSLAMTRRYTDVGGEAAAKAIASLPSLADLAAAGRPAAPPEARPPPGLASMGDDDLRRLAAAVAAEAARRKA